MNTIDNITIKNEQQYRRFDKNTEAPCFEFNWFGKEGYLHFRQQWRKAYATITMLIKERRQLPYTQDICIGMEKTGEHVNRLVYKEHIYNKDSKQWELPNQAIQEVLDIYNAIVNTFKNNFSPSLSPSYEKYFGLRALARNLMHMRHQSKVYAELCYQADKQVRRLNG